jgi:hypothetical protein
MIPQIAGLIMGILDRLTGGRQYRVTGAGGEDKVFKTQEAAQDFLRGEGYDSYTFRPLEGDEQRKLSTTRPRTTMSPRARPDGDGGGRTGGLRRHMENLASGGLFGLLTGGQSPMDFIGGGAQPQPVYDYPGSRVPESVSVPSYSAPNTSASVTVPPATTAPLESAPAGSDLTGGVLNERMIGLLGLNAMPGEPMTQADLRALANAGFYDTENLAALPPQVSTGTPLAEGLLPTNVELYGDPLGREVQTDGRAERIFNNLRSNPMYQMVPDAKLREIAAQVVGG